MREVLLCLVSLALVAVSALEDDSYSDFIRDKVDDATVDDGANAISRFLGFKCPKGHRCLPVLECLPCDFGTYKSNEGSDLCENCSPGCTTLRKGAVSRKECVPKCPPGYEESECGKTCTKCRPGYYKSNWKNIKCHPCPKRANWNPMMVGMNKKRQCFQSAKPECHSFKGDVVVALDVSNSVTTEDFEKQLDAVNDFIDAFEVSDDNTQFTVYTYPEYEDEVEFKFYTNKSELKVAVSGLRMLDAGYTEVWPYLRTIAENVGSVAGNRDDVQDIVIFVTHGMSSSLPETTAAANELKAVTDKVFAVGVGETGEDELLEIASHEDYVVKVDNIDGLAERLPKLTKDACNLFKEDREPEDDSGEDIDSTTSGVDWCALNDTCTQEDYEVKRLKLLSGSDCKKFCHCAHAVGSAGQVALYYWEEQTCAEGTLFDVSLDVPVCNHKDIVKCPGASTPQPTSGSPNVTSGPHGSTTASVPGIDWCTLNDTCTQEDYEVKRLKLLSGSDCKKFCHCAHAVGSAGQVALYYWEEQICAEGTLFDVSLDVPVCNHKDVVKCPGDSTPQPTSGSPNATSGPHGSTKASVLGIDWCTLNDTCTQEDYEVKRLKLLSGSDCKKFCHCAHAAGSAGQVALYYWEEQTCGEGTLFDVSLDVPVCNHKDVVECPGASTPQPNSGSPYATSGPHGSTTASVPGIDWCTLNDTCTQEDYEVKRLKLLSGSDCKKFCHCAHAVGSAGQVALYYWEEQTCGEGTLFDVSLDVPICNHKDVVECPGASTPQPTSGSPNATSGPHGSTMAQVPGIDWCTLGNPCTQEDYELERLKLLSGSDCKKFCHCAHAEGSAGQVALYYWEEQTCGEGTLFDVSLIVPLCNHNELVECPDSGTTPLITTTTAP